MQRGTITIMPKAGIVFIIVVVLLIAIAGFLIYFYKNNEASYTNPPLQENKEFVESSRQSESEQEYDKNLTPVSLPENLQATLTQSEYSGIEGKNSIQETDEPPLKIKNIGVNLDYYDSATGKAGDFVFTKAELQFNRLFMGFGFVIPADMSSTRELKFNPQPTFVVPLGTPVRSLVDGIVVSIPILWSGDYSIQVTSDGKMQKWIYETEHLINPKVKVGDKVTAGQIVGEVSDFNHGAPDGFGTVEIGILKGGNSPSHVCPFAYLDQAVKEDIEKKIISLQKSWEEYIGDSNLYDESANTFPGCLTLNPIEG